MGFWPFNIRAFKKCGIQRFAILLGMLKFTYSRVAKKNPEYTALPSWPWSGEKYRLEDANAAIRTASGLC